MPPVVAAAAVTGAAGLGAAFMGSKANNHAADAQRAAAQDAIAYQKQRQAVEDQRYQTRWNAYQDYVNAWRQRNGYGGKPAGAGPSSSLGTARAGLAGLGSPVASPVASPGAMGSMASVSPGGAGPGVPADGSDTGGLPAGTLADLGKWTDWRQYGAGV